MLVGFALSQELIEARHTTGARDDEGSPRKDKDNVSAREVRVGVETYR
jgi:hypothetical protein